MPNPFSVARPENETTGLTATPMSTSPGFHGHLPTSQPQGIEVQTVVGEIRNYE